MKKGTWLLKSGFVHDPRRKMWMKIINIIERKCSPFNEKFTSFILNTEVCVSIMSSFIKSARWDWKDGLVGRYSHVAVALLMLSNKVLENGHVVEKTSTSLPCSWNKGKKRNKTPRKLHESMYESSNRKHPGDLYHWGPRPIEYIDDSLVTQIFQFEFFWNLNNWNSLRFLETWRCKKNNFPRTKPHIAKL